MAISDFSFSDVCRKTLEIEELALKKLKERVNSDFDKICCEILSSDGRLIISGIGKSGLVGRKISATLSSTGTPSFFVHPGEAFHGDLGMILPGDIFLALSYSGETEEILKMLPFLKANKNLILSFTSDVNSTLAQASAYHIDVSVEYEACPLKLAPTASTTACLAMGDALAVALMEARGFKKENFARFHPGGRLGRQLLRTVREEMTSDSLPIIPSSADFSGLVSIMSSFGLGIAIVVDLNGAVEGLITDGDLRRAIEKYEANIFKLDISHIMTKEPLFVHPNSLVSVAEKYMEDSKVTTLLVIENDNVVGVLKK